MRYCYNCHRITNGPDPLYCNSCGKSYEVQLCPRLHVNTRTAQFCSLCGSRDLSVPQPRTSWWISPFLWLLTMVPGVLLLVLSILLLITFVRSLIVDPQTVFPLMLAGLLLGPLWLGYVHLAEFVRKVFSKRWPKPSKHNYRPR